MKTRSRSLLDKSLGAMLAALEIYNKPVFNYREESFAILAVNAWELLLKARVVQLSSNKISSILVYENRRKADGKMSEKLYRKQNRAGNFSTIGIFKALDILDHRYGETISPALKANIEALIEIRDNAVHFLNKDFVFAKGIHEIGTAAVKNYVAASKLWFDVDLGGQGMFLMPMAFLSNIRSAEGVGLSNEEKHLVHYLDAQRSADGVASDKKFDVALTIEISMKRSKTEGAKFTVTNGVDAIPIRYEESDIRDTHPWSYENLNAQLKQRYIDFSVNKKYHGIRKGLENNPKHCRERLLDPGKPNGVKKKFYNKNIIKEFDSYYERR
ncbi:MAG: DUF3644 domain-containing protein [Pseudomonas sp.]|jgi:hypothetical protein|nr:MAG: DUF3644 domain-containing protein [Pseudomonas sp.]